MRRKLLPILVSLGVMSSLVSPGAGSQGVSANRPARASSGSLSDRFAGTWKLVSVEQRNAKGEVVPPPAPAQNRLGYIIYDSAGYMAVSIMPVGRKKYADAQPTDEEALAALTGYTAYYGTYIVNEAEGFVTHRLQGSVNPGMATDQKRFFELSGNRLTLKPPPAANGNQARLTWERMPDLQNPTAEQRRFFGFWKLISNERRDDRGELLASNPGQSGYIIYTRAGFMAVHMIQPNRTPYTAAQPTPAEARLALRMYTNYFGPFYVHEADGYVVHDQVGSLGVGRIGPSPQQRFYRLSGNRLLLQPPPTFTPGAPTVQGTITWERVATAGPTQ